jgi:hypothetical protein
MAMFFPSLPCKQYFNPRQLDSGEDEKTTLWRVVVMDHKKEEFINAAKKDLRVFVKEYDEDEIINLPKEMKERDQIKNSIEEKKVNKALYLETIV